MLSGMRSVLSTSVEEILTRRVELIAPNPGGSDNKVITSKFTMYSFVPVTLHDLLHPTKRFANFYFLCVGALQLWPEISVCARRPNQQQARSRDLVWVSLSD